MDRSDLNELTSETFRIILSLQQGKGAEYSGNDDALANFKRGALRRNFHPMDILMVYMDKHLDAINTYVRNVSSGTPVKLSEPIFGRIDDAINYLILLKGLIVDVSAPSMVSSGDDTLNSSRDGSCPDNAGPGLSDLRNPDTDKLSPGHHVDFHRRIYPERHGRP